MKTVHGLSHRIDESKENLSNALLPERSDNISVTS